jgi:sterol desaturase/sphingolipid hydroxylase (fatty acid hydroxylase superfamily)
MNTLLAWEPWIRVAAFAAAFLPLAAWESASPRRRLNLERHWRWPHNLALVVVGTLLLRAVFPLAAVGAAALAAQAGWGLMNRLPVGGVTAFVLTLLLLDLAIWAQHRLFHRVPLLWRLHRMHHADLDLDVTSGLRFHPLELALSMLLKIGLALLLGAPPLAVLAFEVLLNASSMFNHANVALSPRVDAWLRWLVVTPDMHRVHHSWDPRETDTNFGFNLSCWDRLFGSYLAQPRLGHQGMTIGLHEFRDPGELRLDRMLRQPFVATQR